MQEKNHARDIEEVKVPEHPMPRPSLKLMDLPVPEGQTILRIEVFRDPSPRKFKWQFWLPKYGPTHYLSLTEKGVYDVTEAIKEQTR